MNDSKHKTDGEHPRHSRGYLGRGSPRRKRAADEEPGQPPARHDPRKPETDPDSDGGNEPGGEES